MVHKHEDLHTAGISVDELCDSEDVVAMHNMVSMYQLNPLSDMYILGQQSLASFGAC